MARQTRHGLALAAKEHLAEGKPLTRLEAIVLFGVANLPDLVKEMKQQGWVIESRQVPYAAALKRLNEYASLVPPNNLPTRDIMFTEYWIPK
jgi:hypothetical protein